MNHVHAHTSYTGTDSGHWLICTDCGSTQSDEEAHINPSYTFNLEAPAYHFLSCEICGIFSSGEHRNDCLHPDTCVDCGAAYSSGSADHDTSLWQYGYDENSHWIKCDLCGQATEQNVGPHWSNGVIQSDATGHWYDCGSCGQAYDFEAHHASCTNPGVCYDCGIEDASLEGQHDPTYSIDASTHWLSCMHCGQALSENEAHVNPSCSYDDEFYHKFTCDVCGDFWRSHSNNCLHPDTCVDCGAAYSSGSADHDTSLWQYGYDENGHWIKCDLCGQATEHNVGPHWSNGVIQSDATGHWYDCGSCGQAYDFEAHHASCTNPGVCYDCGIEDASLEGQHSATYAFNSYTHGLICEYCYEVMSEREPHVNPQYTYSNENVHTINCDVCGFVVSVHLNDCQHPDTCVLCGGAYSGGNTDHVTDNWQYGYDENGHWIKCDVCGEPTDNNVGNHWAAGEIQMDKTGHWYNCGDCGQKVEFASHFAACNASGVCIHCGYEDASLEGNHDFIYGIWYDFHCTMCRFCSMETSNRESHVNKSIAYENEYVHVLSCDICGTGYFSHENNCLNTDTCAVCGGAYSGGNTDHVTDNWQYGYDEKGHWIKCDVCGEPTDNNVGNHWAAGEIQMDETGHWYNCGDCGQKVQFAAHSASCTNPGVCATCGFADSSLESEHGTIVYYFTSTSHWLRCIDCNQPQSEEEEHQNITAVYDNSSTHHALVCSVCGTFSHFPHKNDCQHTDTCVDCGGTYSGTAAALHVVSCKNPGLCLVCGLTVTDNIDVQHGEISTDYMADQTHHWQTCSDCDNRIYLETHLLACFENGLCPICLNTFPESQWEHFVDASETEYDSTYHWYTCPSCKLFIKQKHYFHSGGFCSTCFMELPADHKHTVDCTQPTVCNVCNRKVAEGEATIAHTGKNECSPLATDHTLHAIICKGCAQTIDTAAHEYKNGICTECQYEHDHSWSAGASTATCTQAGEISYSCEGCGAAKSEEAAATGHAWYEAENVAPSCTVDGKIVTACENCDETTTEVIAATGHAWYEAENVAPSCTVDGKIVTACKNCDETTTEVIDAIGHAWYEAENIAPSCTVDGKIVTACKNCDESTTEVIAATGHAWYEAENIAPSCTVDGKIVTACKNCDETTTEVIEAIGHAWYEAENVAPSCTEKGHIANACQNCEETVWEDYGSATGHQWYLSGSVAATCTANGSNTFTCSICHIFTRKTVDALGHHFGEYLSQQNGTHAALCLNNCGEKLEEACALETAEDGSQQCPICNYTIALVASEEPQPTPVPTAEPTAQPTPQPIVEKPEEAKIEFVATDPAVTSKPTENVQLIITIQQPVFVPTPAPAAGAEETSAIEQEAADVEKGILPEETPVPELPKEEPIIENTVIAAFQAENPQAQIMSVTLIVDEVEVELTEKVRISIPVAQETIKDFRLVFLDENGEIMEIEYEIIDGQIVFETDVLGYFALIPVE
ncbi:MAG: hypothetical protein E7329_00240 [Clostridiales bacterium]|nr:hypothetical protein [Clostridiales bacterium]